MIFEFIKNKISWGKIDKKVSKQDVCLCLPGYFILIRKNSNFLVNINNKINYFINKHKSNWLTFINDANFSKIKNTNNIKLSDIADFYRKIDEVHDLYIITTDLKIIDFEDFIYSREKDSRTKDNLFYYIKSKQNFIEDINNIRSESLYSAGTSANLFLKNRTVGRYFIDASSIDFASACYEFKTLGSKANNYGYGRSWNFKDATNIALLEGVERYISQYYAYNNVNYEVFGSFNYLTSNGRCCVMPSRLILETNSNVNNDSKLYWTEAQSIVDGKKCLVPEDVAFYGNNFYRDNYQRRINDSSNGVALGSTYTEAIINGILELIERHSFLTTWYGEIPGKKINNYKEYLDENTIISVNKFLKRGFQINLYEISFIEDVYVVWCLIRNFDKDAKMFSYNAAGSGITLRGAIKAAIVESVVGMSVQNENHTIMPDKVKTIKTLEDHIDFYGNNTVKDLYDFVNESKSFSLKTNTIFNSTKTQEDILEIIEKKILDEFDDIYVVNLTSNELKKHNLFGVKCIIPGMFPMTFGDKSQRLNKDYINKQRRKNGINEIDEIKLLPHPFP